MTTEIPIAKFIVKTPLLVSRLNIYGRAETLGIPQDGVIGFCGRHLFARGTDGKWQKLLTPKATLLRWMQDKHVAKETPVPKIILEEFKKAIAQAQQEERATYT